MLKKLFVFGMILSLALAVSVSAQDGDISEIIARGDALADEWKHQEAAVEYAKALKIDPDNYEANWKLGEQYTELADALSEKQKDQKETYFGLAEKYCNKAIELNPEGWEGHLKLSVVYGRLGLFRGGKEKVKLAQQVKAEAEKAIEINPRSDQAYHVLARWHQNVANLSGLLKFFAKTFFGEELKGSNEEAVHYFKKAIEINPDHIEHHLELAKTYELMKSRELMRQPLETALSLPSVEPDDDEFKAEAKKLLKKAK